MITVQNGHDGKDIELLQEFLRVIQFFSDGIALQDHRLSSMRNGHLVIGRNAVISGQPRHERLPSAGVSGKVVRFDTAYGNDGVCFLDEFVQHDLITVPCLA